VSIVASRGQGFGDGGSDPFGCAGNNGDLPFSLVQHDFSVFAKIPCCQAAYFSWYPSSSGLGMAEPGLVYSGGVDSFAMQATMAVPGGPQIRLWVGKAYDLTFSKRPLGDSARVG
jgi:hypothetical protein